MCVSKNIQTHTLAKYQFPGQKLKKVQDENSDAGKEFYSEKAATPKTNKNKENHFLEVLQIFVQKYNRLFAF